MVVRGAFSVFGSFGNSVSCDRNLSGLSHKKKKQKRNQIFSDYCKVDIATAMMTSSFTVVYDELIYSKIQNCLTWLYTSI